MGCAILWFLLWDWRCLRQTCTCFQILSRSKTSCLTPHCACRFNIAYFPLEIVLTLVNLAERVGPRKGAINLEGERMFCLMCPVAPHSSLPRCLPSGPGFGGECADLEVADRAGRERERLLWLPAGSALRLCPLADCRSSLHSKMIRRTSVLGLRSSSGTRSFLDPCLGEAMKKTKTVISVRSSEIAT